MRNCSLLSGENINICGMWHQPNMESTTQKQSSTIHTDYSTGAKALQTDSFTLLDYKMNLSFCFIKFNHGETQCCIFKRKCNL